MSWVGLISGLVQLLSRLFQFLRDQQMVKAGHDAAVAAAALALLERTKAGKELRERLMALDDKETDALWQRMLDAGRK